MYFVQRKMSASSEKAGGGQMREVKIVWGPKFTRGRGV